MGEAVAGNPNIWGKQQPDQLDVRIARLAARQHGVVSRRQLLELGLHPRSIDHRLETERLHRVHWGVYAVGHRVLSREARWMAAVLAGGEDAALSHWSAASLWGLRQGAGPLSHVTIPRKRRSCPGIGFHYAQLADDEVSEHPGIPVTTPARTVLDLAPHMTVPSLTRALEQLERLRLDSGPSIPELLERYPRRAGTPKLCALGEPLAMTRSELEARFLDALGEWGLPRPQLNVSVDGYEVDFAWPEHRLIVELDAFDTHGSTFAFERDRLRDRRLQAAGWIVIRITAAQLEREPHAVRADLVRLLER